MEQWCYKCNLLECPLQAPAQHCTGGQLHLQVVEGHEEYHKMDQSVSNLTSSIENSQ